MILPATVGSSSDIDYESSCSLHINTIVYPPSPVDEYGKARVYVRLCTRENKPIPFQEIQLVSTNGEFSCKPADADSKDTINQNNSVDNCNVTDKSGNAMFYLVNIMFNIPGKVIASCDYGPMSVKVSCTYSITRHYKKK